MKKSLIVLLAALMVAGCGKVERTEKLASDTPAYALAQKMAEKVPFLNPDINNDLIQSKTFVMTTGDVALFMAQSMGMTPDQIETTDVAQLRNLVKNVARSLLDRKLLLLAAKEQKVAPAQAELDSVVNIYVSREGSMDLFAQKLAQNGMSVEAFQTEIREGLQRQKYLQNAMADLPKTATEEEIAAAYETLKKTEKASVRHILLLTENKNATEKAAIRRKMEGILRRAKRGEDFAKLAKTYTEDPGSKDNGGLYENFGRGEMVKPFEEAAFTVPIGEISDIVETRYGYHILKIIDRKGDSRPLEVLRPQLQQQVLVGKQNQRVQELISDLKLKHKVTQVEF